MYENFNLAHEGLPCGGRHKFRELVFDKLAEVKEAPKTNNSTPSAYRWYGRSRVVQEVKTPCAARAFYTLPPVLLSAKHPPSQVRGARDDPRLIKLCFDGLGVL